MKNILIIALTLLLVSCGSKKLQSITDITSYDISNLLIDVNINDTLITANRVLALDNYIIYNSQNTENAIIIYNTNNATTQSPILYGKGANEIMNIGALKRINNFTFYAYDILQSKVFIFNKKNNDSYRLDTMFRIDGVMNFSMCGNLTIGQSSDMQHRYIIKSNSDSISFGDYEYNGCNVLVGNQLYGGIIVANEKQKRFASFSINAQEFQIVDFSDIKNCHTINSQEFSKPIYQIDNNERNHQVVFTGRTQSCFQSVTNNDNYIYALFAGHNYSDFSKLGNEFEWGHNIFIIDWDGNILSNLYSDRLICHISYNVEKDAIFCIVRDYDLSYRIMSLELSKINL